MLLTESPIRLPSFLPAPVVPSVAPLLIVTVDLPPLFVFWQVLKSTLIFANCPPNRDMFSPTLFASATFPTFENVPSSVLKLNL